ncbi:Pleckstrin y domain-containing A member 2 [Entomortierella beljakovae]|nr:Pleckstrin y domain-containing A member 2 [Entomortierella beljakovae]
MLRKRSSSTHIAPSPSTPIPARPGTSAGHYQIHNESPSGVRRALSSIQNALQSNRRSPSDDNQQGIAIVNQQNHKNNNIKGQEPHIKYLASAHSNGTSDSIYSSGTIITPLTTDDDSSSTNSHPFHRTFKLSKTGSLPSPLGSLLHNDNSIALSNQSTRSSEIACQSITPRINGYASSSLSTTTDSLTPLFVRDFEHGASYSGYLTKFSSRTFFSRKQWKRRYFILNQSSLHCFKSSDPQHPLLESLKLCSETIICVTDIFSGKRYCLQLTTPGEKNWYVLADTADEMSGWLRELKGVVLRFRNHQTGMRPGTHYSDSSEMSDISTSSAAMGDGVPTMPSIPSQYDPFTLVSRSPSPPPRPPPPRHQIDLFQFSATPITHEKRKRKNSSISTGPSLSEYASFGTVMEQADAAEPERKSTQTHLKPDLTGSNGQHSRPTSPISNGRRTSIIVDRPETMITLPRRSSQRLTGSPSRPMSPVSSRPTSPNHNRPSPRSSLVVTPPPRSIHRPSSSRHSTQSLPLHMANMSLQSGNSRPSSPIDNRQYSESALSRATSFRLESLTGSLQERSYRSPSRPSIITISSRPTSPSPSILSPPLSPLPESPRSESPSHGLKQLSSGGSSHRIQIVPRHHDPDQFLKNRSFKPHSRTKSQEYSVDSRLLDNLLSGRTNTPSPCPSDPSPDNENDTLTIQLEPLSTASSSRANSPIPSRTTSVFLHHKHSVSNSSLRSVGSTSSTGSSASFGGAVSRKPLTRDPTLSVRLSNLAPLPAGSTINVPLPPQMALPPIPVSDTPLSTPTKETFELEKGTEKMSSMEEEEEEEAPISRSSAEIF